LEPGTPLWLTPQKEGEKKGGPFKRTHEIGGPSFKGLGAQTFLKRGKKSYNPLKDKTPFPP